MIKIALLLLHVLVAAGICGLVLLQHGKGADMGAAFGSGSSGSLFGASGAANFLSRSTAVLATVFFLTSVGLTWYSTQKPHSGSVMDTHTVEQPAPAAPTPAAPANADSAPQPATAPDDSKARDIPK